MKSKTKKVSRKKTAVSIPVDAPPLSRFEADLLTRGEAVELTPEGTLPLDATHAVVKKPDGTSAITRVRFKLV